mgnify:CR=1 FL=1
MEGNNLKSFENLTRIFETRIKLDKEKCIETPPDVLINYEKYTKKIDAIYNDRFEREIKSLITPEVTIEKEEERLKKLISLLKDRLNKREELENRFYLTTGRYISNLQLVVSESELEDKQNRLDRITKYLDTRNEINNVTSSLEDLKQKLKEEVAMQDEYTKKNKIMEEELYTSFLDVISGDDYLSKISEDDIDGELALVIDKAKENKETLDVTKESVNSLLVGGTDDDYTSYIEDAERMYFTWENRELLLRIYAFVVAREDNYNGLFDKRDNISKILRKRRGIRDSLSIEIPDNILSLENLLKEELEVLKNEKEVIENVSNYTNRISFKEERLEELEKLNNDIEILTILREYGLIDTYDNKEELSNIPLEEEEPLEIEAPIKEEEDDEVIAREINPYRILEVVDYPKTLNLGLAKLKGESVREKVNKKLNPPSLPTFEDINAEISSSTNEEDSNKIINNGSEVEVQKVEEPLPSWTIPSEEVKPIDSIPSWTPNIEKEDNTPKNDKIMENNIPSWTIPINIEEDKKNASSSELNKDLFSNNLNNNIDISSKESKLPDLKKEDSSINNNMFWMPVSDSKLENNTFPNININVGNNSVNKNDNFGFPDLNS